MKTLVKKVYDNIAKEKQKEKSEMMAKVKAKAAAAEEKRRRIAAEKRGGVKLPEIGLGRGVSGQETKRRTVNYGGKAKPKWIDLLEKEHANAIISDSFWYVICVICNPKKEFRSH